MVRALIVNSTGVGLRIEGPITLSPGGSRDHIERPSREQRAIPKRPYPGRVSKSIDYESAP